MKLAVLPATRFVVDVPGARLQHERIRVEWYDAVAPDIAEVVRGEHMTMLDGLEASSLAEMSDREQWVSAT